MRPSTPGNTEYVSQRHSCVKSRVMEKLLFLLVLLTGSYCYTEHEDLSDTVIVFPRRSYVDNVKLIPSHYHSGLDAMTICLRFLSGDKDGQTIFSIATTDYHNSPLLYKYADSCVTSRAMEKLLFLLVLLTGSYCHTEAEDLSDTVIVFPRRSYVDNMKLFPSHYDRGLDAMTICLRFLSGDKDGQTIFSIATTDYHNSPLLYKYADRYEVYMPDITVVFWGLPNELNKWHSVCFTWDSNTGLVQLLVDGVGRAKQLAFREGHIKAKPSIILGQDQDNYGGGFAWGDSFVGLIKDVHVWDKVLTNCEIHNFQSCEYHTPGIELCCVTSRAMEKFLFLLVLLTGSYCHTENEDLSGKVFVFPRRSDVDNVKLIPSHYHSGLDAMTICLRFFSGDKDDSGQTLFSMATTDHHNSPLLYKHADRYKVYMPDGTPVFWGLPNELNKWHSICFTWASNTGLVQLWVDGVGSAKQLAYRGGHIKAEPSIIIGQDQDDYGGGFLRGTLSLG
ncbi:hypothetical protein AAFF_G00234110 [Aldrovandia affinis]|uniref:Pentraxin (PTX) domain-containing protein n=1 Tax=Aldrovandia affinis TaxID=143900 RepID=A0AAD7REQ6_9TELE|nr:hypothetical protein AAFF_G00234110 [Aldrovandia affinis]